MRRSDSENAYCQTELRTFVIMVSHGHEHCPHCGVELQGGEPLCPSCSGALFGVARQQSKTEIAKETAKEIASRTSDAISSVSQKASELGRSAMSTVGAGMEKASGKIGEMSMPTINNKEQSGEEIGVIPIMDAQDTTDINPDETITPTITENMDETSRLISEGEALAAAGKPGEASEKFRNAIATDPTNADCWFNLGVVQEQMGNADESIKSFQVALVHKSNHGPAMANLSVLMDAMGDEGASKMAQQALEHFPGHPVLIQISNSHTPTDSESIVETIPSETSVESTFEDSESHTFTPTAGLVIGANTSSVNDESDSINDQLIEVNDNVEEQDINDELNHKSTEIIASEIVSPEWGDEQDMQMNRAADMLRSGDSLDVITMIEGEFIQNYSTQARPHKILGAAYALQDRVEDAISSFTTGLNLDNNDAPGWYNLGRLHIRNGYPDAGFTCFRASQMVDSSHVSSARAIVEHLRQTDDYSKLVPAWIHLSTLEDLGESSFELARILVEIGEGETIMIESNPDLPRTLPEGPELGQTAVDLLKDEQSELMVRALSLSGDHTEATRISKSILERNTNDPSAWRLMAKVLESQGNSDRATQCRDKANKLEDGLDLSTQELIESEVQTEIETEISDSIEVITANENNIVKEKDEVDPWADLVADDKIEESPQTSVVIESEVYTPESADSVVEDTRIVPTIVEETSISASDLLAPVEQDSTYSEPEPKPEVDLAKAALDAASKMIPDSYVAASSDSGAMSNSSVEWYNKALFLMEDKKYSEALSCFDKALVGSAEDEDLAIRVLNGRGHAFYYMEQYPEAIKAYFEAMRINKDKVTGATLYNMGTAYAFVELYDDAIKCFKQAMPRGLEDEQKKMCKEQIKRCNELQKIQKRKLSR